MVPWWVYRYRYSIPWNGRDVGMDHGVLTGDATGNEAPIVDINKQLDISDIDVEVKKKREREREEDEGRRLTRIRIALPCLVRT